MRICRPNNHQDRDLLKTTKNTSKLRAAMSGIPDVTSLIAGIKPRITPETFCTKLMAVRTVQAAVPTIAKQVAFLSVMSGLWSREGTDRNLPISKMSEN
jgi:hypothetical protein